MTVTTKAALAAELGITKARVSQYVKRGMPVRSDGKLDRESAVKWISDNHPDYGRERQVGVKRANDIAKRDNPSMRRPLSSVPASVGRSDILAETMISRTEDWHEIYVETPRAERDAMRFDISAIAVWFSVESSDVLTWLRAGCPYAVESDWATGEGFKLTFSWTNEWTALVLGRLVARSDHASIRALGLASLLRDR